MIQNLIKGAIQKQAVDGIAKALGMDTSKVQKIADMALPLFVGATAKQAKSGNTSGLLAALDKDHDGSILDDLGGLLGNKDKGNKILGHLLGSKQTGVAANLGKSENLKSSETNDILSMLAPVFMGALGKQKKESNLDESGLSDLLLKEEEEVKKDSGMKDMLTGLIDQDGDGDMMDDLFKMGKKFLS